MRKPISILLLFFMLALALSACAGLTPPPLATSVQPTAAELAAATSSPPTAAPAQPTAAEQATAVSPQAAAPTAAGTPAKPECRVDTTSKTDPSLAERYPKVGNTDWTQGPDTAYVNIIEYSDFQ